MTTAPAIGAAALALLLLSAARHASAQAIPEPTVAFRQAQSLNQTRPDSAASGRKAPSNLRLNLGSIASGASGAILGAGTGLVVDGEKCEREHQGKPDTSLFGPCFFPADIWTKRGWFAGGVMGATLGAASIARKRGCPAKSAFLRALAGALAGSIPAFIVVQDHKGAGSESSGVFVVTAPLLAGAGAALAVSDCRGK